MHACHFYLFLALWRGIDLCFCAYLSSSPCRRHRGRRGRGEGWPAGPRTPWPRGASLLPWIAPSPPLLVSLSQALSFPLSARTGYSLRTLMRRLNLSICYLACWLGSTPVGNDGRQAGRQQRGRRARYGGCGGLGEGIGAGEPFIALYIAEK